MLVVTFRSSELPPALRTLHMPHLPLPLQSCPVCASRDGRVDRPLHHHGGLLRFGPNLGRISLRRLQTKICDTLIAFRVIDRREGGREMMEERKDPKKEF